MQATTSRPPDAAHSRPRHPRSAPRMSGRAARSACRPSAMHSCARWNSNRPILASFGVDHDVRRIAGEARAGDAVLRDVEGVDHDRRDARAHRACAPCGRAGAGKDAPPPAAAPSDGALDLLLVAGLRRRRTRSTVPRTRTSLLRLTQMTMSAPSARATLTGIGLTRAPSISQRPPRIPVEDAGQGVGGPHRLDERPARQPDLVAGHELRGDGAEADRQALDAPVLEVLFQQRAQPAAADQAGAGEAEIEQPHHPALGQRQGEFLEGVELAGGVAAAHHRADRAAGHDLGLDARSPSSTRITPICDQPRAAPPPRASPILSLLRAPPAPPGVDAALPAPPSRRFCGRSI